MTINYFKKAVKRRMRKLLLIPIKLCNTLYYWVSNKDNVLVVNASVFQFLSKTRHFNLGDDLNVYMLKYLTGKRIFVNNQFYHRPLKNYMCIGSVMDWMANEQTSVWGAGIIIPPLKKRAINKLQAANILAVRGAYTRDLLTENGIACPSVYGDPALLLPYLYNPKVEKVKNRIGFIPHFYDKNNKNVKRLINECEGNGILIKMQGYDNWQEIIRQILSCEFIISSSLHGLILSDAYSIPNLWVSFSDLLKGGMFKFNDYYSSVGKVGERIEIGDNTHIKELLEHKRKYIRGYFDPRPLLKVCPFTITHPLIKELVE